MTPGLCAHLACLLDVVAPKAGNVSIAHRFDDATYHDFVLSAAAIGPVLDRASTARLGETVLDAVRATRAVTGTNTNLGIVLLLAPLAAAFRGDGPSPRERIRAVLDAADVADAEQVYEAIRLARPGGLGNAPAEDVGQAPTLRLREVMALARDRDVVARQYATDFEDVFELGVPSLEQALDSSPCVETAVVSCQLHLMAARPDTLIRRKAGERSALRSSALATAVLEAGWPGSVQGRQRFAELDAWLRADGRRLNPGATADLVTASVFRAIESGLVVPFSPGK